MSIYTFVLKTLGFKLEGEFTQHPKKVIIAAPHTSSIDFVVGYMALRHFKIKPHFIIKKEFFFFPLGIILKKLGAIPVDRGNIKNNFVDFMVNEFNRREQFNLVITPEGTRKKTKHWKKGFYLIAQKANVPIVVTTLDYGHKKLGPVKTFFPSGDYYNDLKIIRDCYVNVIGKNPEKFELPAINE